MSGHTGTLVYRFSFPLLPSKSCQMSWGKYDNRFFFFFFCVRETTTSVREDRHLPIAAYLFSLSLFVLQSTVTHRGGFFYVSKKKKNGNGRFCIPFPPHTPSPAQPHTASTPLYGEHLPQRSPRALPFTAVLSAVFGTPRQTDNRCKTVVACVPASAPPSPQQCGT